MATDKEFFAGAHWLAGITLAPAHIERLLWYWTRGDDWHGRGDRFIQDLIAMSMLSTQDAPFPSMTYGLTPKGKAYVQAILDLSPDAKPAKRSRSVSCHLAGITVTITEEPTE